MLFAAVALLASCETDVDTPQIYKSDKFVAPVVGQCNDVIVNADNSDTENVVFTWKAADFGQPVQVLYSLYVASGETSALVGTSNATSLAVVKGDLNGAVINGLGVAANTTAEVSVFVTAKMANTDDYEAIKSEMSNSFKIKTYALPLKWLHLCGEFNNWTIAEAPIFYETKGGTNIYECMVDFTTTNETPTKVGRSYFKVTVAQNWSDANWGYNALTPSWADGNTENNDSNLSLDIAEKCINKITVNTTVMTIDLEAIGKKLSLVGSFNDWSDEPFVYSPKESAWITAPVTLAANAEIKVRVDGDWAINWGDSEKMSTAIANGYELVKGGGNIKVVTAGTYIVKLHANRTPYVLELVAQ